MHEYRTRRRIEFSDTDAGGLVHFARFFVFMEIAEHELLRALGTITRAGGICSIIVEQNAQKILGLADRVVILERGAIVHDAASAALKADPAVLERFLGVSSAAAH